MLITQYLYILRKFIRAAATAVAVVTVLFSYSPAAEAQKAKDAAANGTKKSLETSKRVKYSDKTAVDFDAANIDGSVKNPFGSIVQSRDQGFDKGFIRLRTHWHDQMVMSLSGLSGN